MPAIHPLIANAIVAHRRNDVAAVRRLVYLAIEMGWFPWLIDSIAWPGAKKADGLWHAINRIHAEMVELQAVQQGEFDEQRIPRVAFAK